MSEILIIWLSALVSQMAPYLIFILLQKSTHSVNMVPYSQNARLCRNCALVRPTISIICQRAHSNWFKLLWSPSQKLLTWVLTVLLCCIVSYCTKGRFPVRSYRNDSSILFFESPSKIT